MEPFERYRDYCHKHEVPFFLAPSWAEAVSNGMEYGVRTVGDNGGLKGFFLYYLKRSYGFKRIILPPLTPYAGPWLVYPPDQKRASRYSYETEVLQELIEDLPEHDELILNLHPSMDNVLPFIWNGFRARVRYSYVLRAPMDAEQLHREVQENVRRNLKKAEAQLEVMEDEDPEPLYRLKEKDCDRKGTEPDHDLTFLRGIDAPLSQGKKRTLLYARDGEDRIHAGIYLVHDHRTTYYLIGAADPDLRNSEAMTLLLWRGMVKSLEQGLSFDLEGSMQRSIERFFRSFGAERIPYYQVERTPSRLLRMKKAWEHVRNGDL